MSLQDEFKPGVYRVTQGQFKDAAIFLVEVSDPEESDFTYMTIYNPDSKESHEVTSEEWQIMAKEDALVWDSEIPNEIKDAYISGGFGLITGL